MGKRQRVKGASGAGLQRFMAAAAAAAAARSRNHGFATDEEAKSRTAEEDRHHQSV